MLNIFGCDIKEICKHLNNVQWGRISKLESYIGCKFKIFFHSLYFSTYFSIASQRAIRFTIQAKMDTLPGQPTNV